MKLSESKPRATGEISISLNTSLGKQTPDALGDCGLAFAFPLSREEFLGAVTTEPPDGFVRQWLRRFSGYPAEELWLDYAPIAKYAMDLSNCTEAKGVLVERRANVRSWTRLLERRCVTLFAHWVERVDCDLIQFSGELTDISKCVSQLDPTYGGVLDFTVCGSARLIDRVKFRCPKSTVLANRNRARLDVRLAMYRQALRLVESGAYTFVEAVRKVHKSGLEEL